MNVRARKCDSLGMIRSWAGFAVSALLVLATAGISWAQAPAQSTAKPAPAAKSPAVAHKSAPSKSIDTGIKVHGHWVIDVKNPDGKVVQHREFENSLAPTGASELAGLLSGQLVAGGWYVDLYDASNPNLGPCGTAGVVCIIATSAIEPPSACNNGQVSCNLGLAFGSGGSNTITLMLSGSVPASSVGNIGGVSTSLYFCGTLNVSSSASLSTVSPAQCPSSSGSGFEFTSTTLSAPINNVQPGQTVAVVVTFSFQ